MTNIDLTLYRLFGELKEAGQPLSNFWFADGEMSKHILAFAIQETLDKLAKTKARADEPA
jgi:hypothetical protein